LNVEFAYPDDLFEKPKISEEDKDRLVLIIDSEDVKSTYPMLDIAAIKKAFTRSKWAFNRA
jgi:mRNA-degrading endonuclease toxin of MazEF toxin-antitoxin module